MANISNEMKREFARRTVEKCCNQPRELKTNDPEKFIVTIRGPGGITVCALFVNFLCVC